MRNKFGQYYSLKQKAEDNKMVRITMGFFVIATVLSTLMNCN